MYILPHSRTRWSCLTSLLGSAPVFPVGQPTRANSSKLFTWTSSNTAGYHIHFSWLQFINIANVYRICLSISTLIHARRNNPSLRRGQICIQAYTVGQIFTILFWICLICSDLLLCWNCISSAHSIEKYVSHILVML